MHWLRKDLTLREQGIIDETTLLTLRKKLFFHDQNVDINDPVQLNLMYLQVIIVIIMVYLHLLIHMPVFSLYYNTIHKCHDSIINGIYPCTKEEAVQFAAYTCQVQFGKHNPDKHKPKFIRYEKVAFLDWPLLTVVFCCQLFVSATFQTFCQLSMSKWKALKMQFFMYVSPCIKLCYACVRILYTKILTGTQ